VYRPVGHVLCHMVQDGHPVSVRLKIGKMTCLEYTAMKGYVELLSELMSRSVCYETLRQYFALEGKDSFPLLQSTFGFHF